MSLYFYVSLAGLLATYFACQSYSPSCFEAFRLNGPSETDFWDQLLFVKPSPRPLDWDQSVVSVLFNC